MKKKNNEKKKLIKKKVFLKDYLEKAGINLDSSVIFRRLFYLAIFINFLISGWLIYNFPLGEYNISYLVVKILVVWLGVFFITLFVLWVLFNMAIDYKIYQRKKDLEEVLPDFLELTSANINAGMTIDKALWFAVRPRFGVLANEVEVIAKQTMSGEDLSAALRNFAKKYDSEMLKQSISLLIEGIEAGGEIGGLLNKISINIKETQLMKKEMSANLVNYTIFITAASIFSAPLLLALSGALLGIISEIMGSIKVPKMSGLNFSIGQVGVSQGDFFIFSIATLVMTSTFSAIIVSIIRKGDAKESAKIILPYIMTSLILFLILNKAIGYLIRQII